VHKTILHAQYLPNRAQTVSLIATDGAIDFFEQAKKAPTGAFFVEDCYQS
jgi:hypothetical protein